MVGSHHVFAASFGPLNWSTKLVSKRNAENFFAVALEFATETAADIWSHDTQLVL